MAYRERKGRIEFLLVSRSSDPEQFVLPGGRVDARESLPKAARRECLEESGVEVRIHGPLVRYDHYTRRGTVKPTMAYLAGAESSTPSPEGRDVIWAPYDELAEGLYDVPYIILDVLEYAVQCLHDDTAAA